MRLEVLPPVLLEDAHQIIFSVFLIKIFQNFNELPPVRLETSGCEVRPAYASSIRTLKAFQIFRSQVIYGLLVSPTLTFFLSFGFYFFLYKTVVKVLQFNLIINIININIISIMISLFTFNTLNFRATLGHWWRG